STRSWPTRTIADHTVDHDTPRLRAIDAGVPASAATRSAAHPATRSVSTRRGPAAPARSAHPLTSQSGSGHAQTRLCHRTRTAWDPAGVSARVTHRRSFARARTPHDQHPTVDAVVCTSTVTTAGSTATDNTSNPGTPNHTAPQLPS